MKQYKVISAASPRMGGFSEAITEALNDGWELAGPLVVSTGEDADWLYQSLVKFEVPTESEP